MKLRVYTVRNNSSTTVHYWKEHRRKRPKSIMTQHLSDLRLWEWWLGRDAVEIGRNFQTFAGLYCLSLLSEDEGSNLLHQNGKFLPFYTASHL